MSGASHSQSAQPGGAADAVGIARRFRGLPLWTRILLGLLLNVLFIGAAFVAVLVVQVRWNPEWLLAGGAGDRLRLLARALADDLDAVRPDEAEALLRTYGDEHGVELFVFQPGAGMIGGTPDALPPEVRREAGRSLGPGMGRGRGVRMDREPRMGPGAARRRGGAMAMPPPGIVRAGGDYWALVRLPADAPGAARVLIVRAPTLFSGGLLFDMRPWLIAGMVTLGVSGLFWLPFVRAMTRDIGRMMRQTQRIAAGRFDARLDMRREDELGRLADAIDRMASRLDAFVAGQRRFLGDAAHELCSPLARMQAALALIETRLECGEEVDAYLRDLCEEIEQMSALVDELLAFSRTSERRALEVRPIPVREVIAEAWEHEAGGTAGPAVLARPEVDVLGDRALIRRALGNVFRNALRYAGSDGPIEVRATVHDAEVELIVADRGPGVPENELARLFDPFYRADRSRSRDHGGTGLGLAIVKTCVEACGGTVAARNRSGGGLEVVMRLPAARASD